MLSLVTLNPIIGNTENVRRCTLNRASGGSVGMICAICPCTRCSAFRMSTSHRKNALISVAPRAVTLRTSVIPGTSRIACSIGRVTSSICMFTGAIPLSTRITIRGKSVCGNIEIGNWNRNTHPASAKLSTTSTSPRP